MMDYCTKSATEAEFNDLMLGCGLFVEVDDGEGNVSVEPVPFTMSLDRIGPITIQTGVDENGDPITVTYPEYYTNIRVTTGLTDEQKAALDSISIDPTQPQYREWQQ